MTDAVMDVDVDKDKDMPMPMHMDIDAAVSIALGSTAARTLQSLIKAKLIHDGLPTEDVLSEFLVVMLANKKTPSQVKQELVDVIGQIPHDFVPWLFKNAISLQQQQQQQQQQQPQPQPQQRGRLASSSSAPAGNNQQNGFSINHTKPAIHNTKREVGTQQIDSRIRLLTAAMSDAISTAGTGTSSSGAAGGNQLRQYQPQPPSNARPSVLSRLGPQNRTNSNRFNFNAAQQQGQHSHPYYRSDPTARNDNRSYNSTERNNMHQPRMDPSAMMYANQVGAMYQHSYQMMQEMVRMTMQQQQQLYEQDGQHSRLSVPATAKIRCVYWPYCTKLECLFHHPHDPCPYFPHCRFTHETCIFVHPAPLLCKFGTQCKNVHCEYSHLSPAYFKRTSHLNCKYDAACANPTCRFNHPSRVTVKSEVNSAIATNPAITKCKYEPFCNNPNCQYLHSGPNESIQELAASRRRKDGDADMTLELEQTDV